MGDSVVIFKESVMLGVPFFGEICLRIFFFSDVKLIPRTVETKPRNDSVCTVGQVHSAEPTLVQRTSECHHRKQKGSSPDGITSRHPSRSQRIQGCQRCGKARSGDPVRSHVER